MNFPAKRHLSFWAKSEPHHPLYCHLIDVGLVAGILWDRIYASGWKQHVQHLLGLDAREARHLIVWLAAFHDIGKASPQFQIQNDKLARLVRQSGLPIPERFHQKLHHGDVSEQIITPHLRKLWGEDNAHFALMAARCTACHHGYPSTVSDENAWAATPEMTTGSFKGTAEPWKSAQNDLIQCVQNALNIPPPPCPRSSPSHASLAFLDMAGLISFADWIGSAQIEFADPQAQPSAQTPRTDDYSTFAEQRVRKALDTFGWKKFTPPPLKNITYGHLFNTGHPFTPRPLQNQVATIFRDRPDTRLLLIEAPMGEGKTEAALYATAHWIQHFDQRGMYLALPTQATSNAMFRRILNWFQQLHVGKADVHLLHGGFIKPEEYEHLIQDTAKREALLANYEGQTAAAQSTEVHDNLGDLQAPSSATAHEWFLSSKRGLLAPFGTGTIDQALLAILLCRHHFVRLHGLSGKTIIFDEVHAYDAYTGRLLDRLLDYLGALGCTVVLLSATLPAKRRRELVNAFLGNDGKAELGISEEKYPRILACNRPDDGTAAQVTSEHITTSPEAEKTVAIDWLCHNREPALEQLVRKLGDRGCAAWVCNTVRHAQETYKAAKKLKAEGKLDELFILHARFTAGQRAELEAKLLGAFGKDGNRPQGRALVIATQVIEQSLDVDFDLMASDLAPIDLLLQRTGRLHRHRRANRPLHLATPTLLICPPCPVMMDTVPNFGHTVYAESILLRTLALLCRKDQMKIPEEVESMIEEVYGDGMDGEILPPSWQKRNLDYMEAEEKRREQATGKADMMALVPSSDEGAMEDLWWNLPNPQVVPDDEDDPLMNPDLRPVTRLGEDSRRVLCLYSDDRQKRFFFDAAMEHEVPRTYSEKVVLRNILRQVATVTASHLWRDGLKAIDVTAKLLPGADKHGILRHLKVLEFDSEGICRLSRESNRKIYWDQEVGLWDV